MNLPLWSPLLSSREHSKTKVLSSALWAAAFSRFLSSRSRRSWPPHFCLYLYSCLPFLLYPLLFSLVLFLLRALFFGLCCCLFFFFHFECCDWALKDFAFYSENAVFSLCVWPHDRVENYLRDKPLRMCVREDRLGYVNWVGMSHRQCGQCHSLDWGPRHYKKGESKLNTSIALALGFSVTDPQWPAASSASKQALPTLKDCILKPWSKMNVSPHKLLFPGILFQQWENWSREVGPPLW